jgi:hypothetical protein
VATDAVATDAVATDSEKSASAVIRK